MQLTALFKSGSIMVWDTTFFSSDNGDVEGFAIAEDFLDLSNLSQKGVVLVRRAYPFNKPTVSMFSDVYNEEKVLLSPNAIKDMIWLKMDGQLVLARFHEDADGNEILDTHSELYYAQMPSE